MKRLIIHGQRQTPEAKSAGSDFPSSLHDLLTVKHSAKVQRARAGQAPLEIDDLRPDDLIQLELDEGVKLWIRADDLEKDFGLTPTRGPAGEVVELPQVLPIGTPSRGAVGNWVIKALKVFGLDPVGATTDLIKEKVEGVLKPGPGLYRWDGQEPSEYTRITSLEKDKTDDPWLVFIHGTASSTEGSFGGLWEGGANARMVQLLARYPKRMLAFQHRTLSQNPMQNALELAQYFPKGARLHLVSHSRGGLVGELLCRSMMEGRFPFDQDEVEVFAQLERNEDRKQLQALNTVLQRKQLLIERFVRVGCPARGTTLASGRLDRYLSIILNVVQAIPGLKANPVLEGFSAFLLAVVKNRTKPEELPGLEAQMPGSPLVTILNRPGSRTKADLHILGGDLEGEGIVGRLKTFVTDLFYREDHDLVVNTPAMFGGTERTGEVRYWIDTGKNVDHFHYFRNPDTANRLLEALTQKEPHPSFHLVEHRLSEMTKEHYEKRALDVDRPVVYVLPGTMGSHLKVGKDRVWLDKWDLAMGGLKKLKSTAKNVVAETPIASAYKELMRYLSHSHRVIPFPYDWRKSLIDSADTLRRSLETTLDTLPPEQPVRIVAHSMGGLVVRVMIATEAGQKVWDRMCQRAGARFIMLGTPNGGSHAITAMLMGRDPLVQQLDWLDLTNSQTTLLEIISRFDGVLQLLPHGGSLDVFNPEDWGKLRHHDRQDERGAFFAKVASSESAGIYWYLPETAQLTEAKRVASLIQRSPIDPQRMIYVAGRAAATPDDIRIDPSADPNRQILVHTTSSGDGRVPWATGIPSELKDKTYYVDCEHGELANFQESFEGLADLLQSGATTKLSKHSPVHRGIAVVPQAETALSDMYEGRVEMYPDEEDLIASALGSSRVRKARPPVPKVKVSVIHDNLSRASSPVAVGHYKGDTIISAEAYLDRQLDGRLRERLRLGLYPDKLNTSAIVLNDGGIQGAIRHPGAIVVGLGMVGELTPGGLTSTMADALTHYALTCLEAERKRHLAFPENREVDQRLKVQVTTLLIGTTGGGLTVADSLQSVLRGVLEANRRLKFSFGWGMGDSEERESSNSFLKAFIDSVEIDSVEIVELYQDRAILAAKALRELGRSQDFQSYLQIKETLVQGADGQLRAYYEEERDWWQRLRVTMQKDGSLKFEALTNRARAEVYLQPTQRKLVERFLTKAVSFAQMNWDVSGTLFELLIPNRMKEYAPDRRDMVLVLDEESAAFPWELLHNRFDKNSRPLAVEAGMIRQLSVEESQFREKVLHGTAFNALVIGDPTSEESAGTFPPLPGAAAEARNVADYIRRYQVQLKSQNQDKDVERDKLVELVEADAFPEAVLGALHKDSYRILHCAAHGVFEHPLEEESDRAPAKIDPCVKPKTVSGMVLGNGLFLTPAEIEQMRYVPDLVFLNCCYLGKTKARGESSTVLFHRLASNLGTQLIRMGARAVIAAGWAVDDRAAHVFAEKFYDEMLFRDRPFGDAVKLARQAVFNEPYPSNTWGAYQCYGDPDFSFKAGPESLQREGHMVAPAELLVELQVLVRKAKFATARDEVWLLERLDQLKASAEPDWMESAAICAAFGKAYGELGLFEEAVRFYDKGRTLQPADATIESLEQLANLKVRWALKQALEVSQTPQTKEKAAQKESSIKKLIEDAEIILDSLSNIHPTQERYALRGKIYKGNAIVQKSMRHRSQALREMKDWYGKGYDLGKEMKRKDIYYPLANRLAAEIVLSWDSPKTRGAEKRKTKKADPVLEALSALEHDADRLRQHGRLFWDWSLKPDCLLLKALYQRQLSPNEYNDILKGYQEAKCREGSPREMDSVVENVRFFESMLGAQKQQKDLSQLLSQLESLRKSLVPQDEDRATKEN